MRGYCLFLESCCIVQADFRIFVPFIHACTSVRQGYLLFSSLVYTVPPTFYKVSPIFTSSGCKFKFDTWEDLGHLIILTLYWTIMHQASLLSQFPSYFTLQIPSLEIRVQCITNRAVHNLSFYWIVSACTWFELSWYFFFALWFCVWQLYR